MNRLKETNEGNENNKEVEYTLTGSIFIIFEVVVLPRYVSIYTLEFQSQFIFLLRPNACYA